MGRVIIFLYGLACYLVSVGTLLYAIGFLGNFVVTKTIDSGIEDPLGQSLLTNVGLLGFFACLLYTSPSPRDRQKSRMPSSA